MDKAREMFKSLTRIEVEEMKQDKNQEYCFDIPDTSDEDEDQNGPPG